MQKTRFINAIVLTMDNQKIIMNGEVEVQNNLIIYVGKNRNLKNFNGETIDTKGNIIMPGFVNTHCHAGRSCLRGVGDGSSFGNWWIDNIRPLEAKMQNPNLHDSTKLSFLEMIKSGITTVLDLYFNVEGTAKVALETGMRTNIGFGSIAGGVLDELDEEYKTLLSYGELIKPVIYCHAPYSSDEYSYMKAIEFAQKHDLVLTTHASETLEEVGEIHKKFGKTPIGLLESYGYFDHKNILAHCVCCDKDDVELMKEYNTISVSTNPSSNLYLGSGIAPIYSYLTNGINVCIGTGGPASNNCLNMFKEMFLTKNLQSGILNQPDAISAMQTLEMATINGAKALNYNNLGAIKEGFLADIIMVDMNNFNMQPKENFISNLVSSAGVENVLLTMINGRILYRNGKFTNDYDLPSLSKSVDDYYKFLSNTK